MNLFEIYLRNWDFKNLYEIIRTLRMAIWASYRKIKKLCKLTKILANFEYFQCMGRLFSIKVYPADIKMRLFHPTHQHFFPNFPWIENK